MRLQFGLVAGQISLTLILVVTAGTLSKSLWQLSKTDLGFRTKDIATLRTSLTGTRYATAHNEYEYYSQALSRLRETSGVEAVGGIDNLPLVPLSYVSDRFRIDSGPASWAVQFAASPDYFQTIQLPLVQGRCFDRADTPASEPVAIVSLDFVKSALDGPSALGRRLTAIDSDGGPRTYRIIGVVQPVRLSAAEEMGSGQVYIAAAQAPPSSMTLVARLRGRPEQELGILRDVLRQLDSRVVVFDVQTFDQRFIDSLRVPRLNTIAVSLFGAFVLVLAVVGVYGVVTYSVAQQAKRIGISMALGASPKRLRWELLRRTMVPVAVGIAAGVLVSVGRGRVLQYLVANAEGVGIAMQLGAVLAIGIVAATTIWTASGTIMKQDPIRILRIER